MKKIKLLLFACVIAGFTACSDDSNNGPSKNLLELAQERPDLTTFVQALEITGLDEIVDGPEKFTVFAPINSAFSDYLGTNGYASIDAVPVETLKQLIYNHILQGSSQSTTMISGYRKTLARGSASTNFLDMFINLDGEFKINGIATPIVKDISAKNGWLNTVDKVLGLPTVHDHIVANTALTQLEAALALNPESEFVTLLRGTDGSPFTLIAPNDASFATFLTAFDYENLQEIPAGNLEKILQYHIIPGQNILTGTINNGQSFNTLAEQSFTVTLTGGGKKITDASSRVGTLTKTDIQASNGIIHLLNIVLLPTL